MGASPPTEGPVKQRAGFLGHSVRPPHYGILQTSPAWVGRRDVGRRALAPEATDDTPTDQLVRDALPDPAALHGLVVAQEAGERVERGAARAKARSPEGAGERLKQVTAGRLPGGASRRGVAGVPAYRREGCGKSCCRRAMRESPHGLGEAGFSGRRLRGPVRRRACLIPPFASFVTILSPLGRCLRLSATEAIR